MFDLPYQYLMILRIFKYFVILGLSTISFQVVGQGQLNTFFKETNRFMQQYVSNGKVDYRGIKKDTKKLNLLISAIADINPKNERSDVRKAFYINSYNLLVINSVIKKYPIKSINEIQGFFSNKVHVLGGDTFSLHSLENQVIKADLKDARINFLLCKAMTGMPQINKEGYNPGLIVGQVIAQTTLVVNDTSFIKKDEQGNFLLPYLFLENRSDFLLTQNSVSDFINKYRKKPVSYDTLFFYFQPDDKLNDLHPVIDETDDKETIFADSLIKEDATHLTADQTRLEPAVSNIDTTAFHNKILYVFFKSANSFFGQHVYNGRVNYAEIKKNPKKLEQLFILAGTIDITKEKSNTQKAYWINLYNLLVIKNVIEKYPVQSVGMIPEFFEAKKLITNGEHLSLNDIEKEKLKNTFKDPRISFLLCKGELGSPRIKEEAFLPEIFSSQIIYQVIGTLNDTLFVKKQKDGKYRLSNYFLEMKDDFTFSYQTFQQFINKYRMVPVENDSLFVYYQRNQNLNDDPENNLPSLEKSENVNNMTVTNARQVFASEADDGRIPELIFVRNKKFEIRLNNSLNSFRESYNKKLSRNVSRYSSSTDNLTVQLFYGLGRKTTAGFTLTGRSARISSTNESSLKIFDLKNDSNSAFYVRSFAPIIRFNIHEGFIHVRMQNQFSIPLTRIKNLTYIGVNRIDENPYLLTSSLYFYRYLSEYVKINLELEFNFKFDDQIKSFTFSPRPYFNTVFSLPVTKQVGLYGLLETATSGNISSLFTSYSFKEGIGLKLRIGENEITLYYSYIFYGKSIGAVNAFVINLRTGL